MKYAIKSLLLSILLIYSVPGQAQDYYYPDETEWKTKDYRQLNWCDEGVDSLLSYVERTHAKAFIVLHNGEMVIEEYYGTFTQDSAWYWASAGKSLMAFLLGVAQEDGLLNINDKTSDYLGKGWTECPEEKEDLITIKHQLSMTTGLQDKLKPTIQIPIPENCLRPECLQYEVDAGEQWAYHNAPYRLTQDVLEKASGVNKSIYTYRTLKPLDFKGVWINYVYFSTAREMAKFGLLMLSEGKWDGQAILGDADYFDDMISPSQEINPAYGYLWWLNGQDSYRVPKVDFDFKGELIPNGRADMISALGKNDQKIYVVPSRDLVVVRMGNKAKKSLLALSDFDDSLWHYMNGVACGIGVDKEYGKQVRVYPNPTQDRLNIQSQHAGELSIWSVNGSLVHERSISGLPVTVVTTNWPKGCYFVQLETTRQVFRQKVIVY